MEFSLQQAIQPGVMFGPIPLMFLADFKAGGGCWVPPDEKPGTLGVPLPIIPPGTIVCFIAPDVAIHFRAAVEKAKSEGAKEMAITVNGVRLFIYCDLLGCGAPAFTEGIGAFAKPIRTNYVPAGSMLIAITPDLAEKLRPGFQAAIAECQRAERDATRERTMEQMERNGRA